MKFRPGEQGGVPGPTRLPNQCVAVDLENLQSVKSPAVLGTLRPEVHCKLHSEEQAAEPVIFEEFQAKSLRSSSYSTPEFSFLGGSCLRLWPYGKVQTFCLVVFEFPPTVIQRQSLDVPRVAWEGCG